MEPPQVVRRSRRGSIKIPRGTPGTLNRRPTRTARMSMLQGIDEQSVGNWRWLFDNERGYIPVDVQDETDVDAKVKFLDGQTGSVPTAALGPVISSLNILQEDFPDMVMMGEVNDGTILHNLRCRFAEDQVYTNIGTILVSLNPFAWIDGLHDASQIDMYNELPSGADSPPHIFQIANNAYKNLVADQVSQSVIISGESGAGKTEATKKCMQFIAAVAPSSREKLNDQLLLASVILEAFGNAKTVRNNNSSRFGKWMEVQLSPTGAVCGCQIVNYLLEKSRLVDPSESERNYHIFYYLCAGLPESEKRRLGLTQPAHYNYLNRTGCIEVEGLDDEVLYDDMCKDMAGMGITELEQLDMFTLSAAVLHLGDVSFEDAEMQGADGSTVKPEAQAALVKAAELLQVDANQLEIELCSYVRTVQGKSIRTFQPPETAAVARDSLVKALYGRMFDWLVERINQEMRASKEDQQDCKVTGILDIFGFEIFQHNSFEQLCINFCNEKLQQFFNRHVFKEEMKVYELEAIEYEDIVFEDNQDVLDLVELRPNGILRQLDEAGRLPRADDTGFLNTINKLHAENPRFKGFGRSSKSSAGASTSGSAATAANTKVLSGQFCVVHYAGAVVYDVNGFLAKNKDEFPRNLQDFVLSSKSDFIVHKLFANELASSAAAKPAAGGGGRSGRDKSGQSESQGAQFVAQLDVLMTKLESTYPHFVRCVKPNSAKKARLFEPEMCLQQLRYSGVFEAVKIRQEGFPFRKTYRQFYAHYHMLAPLAAYEEPPAERSPRPRSDEWYRRQVSEVVLELQDREPDAFADIRHGKTMVFYRALPHQHLQMDRAKCVQYATRLLRRLGVRLLAHKQVVRVTAVYRGLKHAMRARDLDELEMAVQQARRVVGGMSYTPHVVVLAEQLRQRILEERETIERCHELSELDPLDHRDAYRKTLARADALELTHEAVSRCRARYQTVQARVQAEDDVKRGVAAYDAELVRRGLAAAAAIEAQWGNFIHADVRSAASQVLEHAEQELQAVAPYEELCVATSKSCDNVGQLGSLLSSQEYEEGNEEAKATEEVVETLMGAATDLEEGTTAFEQRIGVARTHTARKLIAFAKAMVALRMGLANSDWTTVRRSVLRMDDLANRMRAELQGEDDEANDFLERTKVDDNAPLEDRLRAHTGVPACFREELYAAAIVLKNHSQIVELRTAFAVGCLKGSVGSIDLPAVRTDGLQAAVQEAEAAVAVPNRAPELLDLLASARLVMQLRRLYRQSLDGGDINYDAIDKLLSDTSVTIVSEAVSEVRLALLELQCRKQIRMMKHAIGSCQIEGRVGALDVSGTSARELQAVVEQVNPIYLSAEGKRMLYAIKQLLLPVRTAVLNQNWSALREVLHILPTDLMLRLVEPVATSPADESALAACLKVCPEECWDEVVIVINEMEYRGIVEDLQQAIGRFGVTGSIGAVDTRTVTVTHLRDVLMRIGTLPDAVTTVNPVPALKELATALTDIRRLAVNGDWPSAGATAAATAARVGVMPGGAGVLQLAQAELELLRREAQDREVLDTLLAGVKVGAITGKPGAVYTEAVDEQSIATALRKARGIDVHATTTACLVQATDLLRSLRCSMRHLQWEALEGEVSRLGSLVSRAAEEVAKQNRNAHSQPAPGAPNTVQSPTLRARSPQPQPAGVTGSGASTHPSVVLLAAIEDEHSLVAAELAHHGALQQLVEALRVGGVAGSVGRIDAATVETTALRLAIASCERETASSPVLSAALGLARRVLDLRVRVRSGGWSAAVELAQEILSVTNLQRLDVDIDMYRTARHRSKAATTPEPEPAPVAESTSTHPATVPEESSDADDESVERGSQSHDEANEAALEAVEDTSPAAAAPAPAVHGLPQPTRDIQGAGTWELVAQQAWLVLCESHNRHLTTTCREALGSGAVGGEAGRVDLSGVKTDLLMGALAAADRTPASTSSKRSAGTSANDTPRQSRTGELGDDNADAETRATQALELSDEQSGLPPLTAETQLLVDTCRLMLRLRSAVRSGDWVIVREALEEAGSTDWAPEAEQELRLLCSEIEERTIVFALREALSQGGATGTVESLRMDSVETVGLERAVRTSSMLGCRSFTSAALHAVSKRVLNLRLALLSGEWPRVDTVLTGLQPLFSAFEEAQGTHSSRSPMRSRLRTQSSGALSADVQPYKDSDEYEQSEPTELRPAYAEEVPAPCREELLLVRSHRRNDRLVRSLQAGLEEGGLTGSISNPAFTRLRTDLLELALTDAAAWGVRTDAAEALLGAAHVMVRIRSTALAHDWLAVKRALIGLGLDVYMPEDTGVIGGDSSVYSYPVGSPANNRRTAAVRPASSQRRGADSAGGKHSNMYTERITSVSDLPPVAQREVELLHKHINYNDCDVLLCQALETGAAAMTMQGLDDSPLTVGPLDEAVQVVDRLGADIDSTKLLLGAAKAVLAMRRAQMRCPPLPPTMELQSAEAIRTDTEEFIALTESVGAAQRCLQLAAPGFIDSVLPVATKYEVENAQEDVQARELAAKLAQGLERGRIGGATGALIAEPSGFTLLNEALGQVDALGAELNNPLVRDLAAVARAMLRARRAVVDRLPAELHAAIEHLASLVWVPPLAQTELDLLTHESRDGRLRHQLVKGLSIGRVTGVVASVNVANISTAELDIAIGMSSSSYIDTDATAKLLQLAKFARRVRTAVVKQDWDTAERTHADWRQAIADGLLTSSSATEELEHGRRQQLSSDASVIAMNSASAVIRASAWLSEEAELAASEAYFRRLSRRVEKALMSGYAVGSVGALDASGVVTDSLKSALAEARIAAERGMRPEGSLTTSRSELPRAWHQLISAAQFILGLRTAQREGDLGTVASMVAETRTYTMAGAASVYLPSGSVTVPRSIQSQSDSESRAGQSVAASDALPPALAWLSTTAPFAAAARREVTRAATEVDDSAAVERLTLAISRGPLTGIPGAVDVRTIDLEELSSAASLARDMGDRSDACERLLRAADVLLELRSNLLADEWEMVTDRVQSARHADAIVPEMEMEIELMLAECTDRRVQAQLRAAAASGGLPTLVQRTASVRSRTISTGPDSSGAAEATVSDESMPADAGARLQSTGSAALQPWRSDYDLVIPSDEQFEFLDIAQLTTAISTASQTGCRSEASTKLLSGCVLVRRLRVALASHDWLTVEQALDEYHITTFPCLTPVQETRSPQAPRRAVSTEEDDSGDSSVDDDSIASPLSGEPTPLADKSISDLPTDILPEVYLTRDVLVNRRIVRDLTEALNHGANTMPLTSFSVGAGVSIAALQRAIGVAESVPLRSREAKQLLVTARAIRDLRLGQQLGDVGQVSDAVREAEQFITDMPAVARGELQRAQQEVLQLEAVRSLTECLANAAVRGIVGNVNTNRVVLTDLEQALVKAERVETQPQILQGLLTTARATLAMRRAARNGEWTDAAAAAKEALTSPSGFNVESEAKLILHEAEDRDVKDHLLQALGAGNITGQVGSINVDNVDITSLVRAIGIANSTIRLSKSSAHLKACAESLLSLRRAVLSADWRRVSATVEAEWDGVCPRRVIEARGDRGMQSQAASPASKSASILSDHNPGSASRVSHGSTVQSASPPPPPPPKSSAFAATTASPEPVTEPQSAASSPAQPAGYLPVPVREAATEVQLVQDEVHHQRVCDTFMRAFEQGGAKVVMWSAAGVAVTTPACTNRRHSILRRVDVVDLEDSATRTAWPFASPSGAPSIASQGGPPEAADSAAPVWQMLDITTIETDALGQAIEFALQSAVQSNTIAKHLSVARLLRRLRTSLLADDREGIRATLREVRGIGDIPPAAQREFDEAEAETFILEAADMMQAALTSGKLQGVPGRLNLRDIDFQPLEDALRATDRVHDKQPIQQLYDTAKMVLGVRQAAVDGDWSMVEAIVREAERYEHGAAISSAWDVYEQRLAQESGHDTAHVVAFDHHAHGRSDTSSIGLFGGHLNSEARHERSAGHLPGWDELLLARRELRNRAVIQGPLVRAIVSGGFGTEDVLRRMSGRRDTGSLNTMHESNHASSAEQEAMAENLRDIGTAAAFRVDMSPKGQKHSPRRSDGASPERSRYVPAQYQDNQPMLLMQSSLSSAHIERMSDGDIERLLAAMETTSLDEGVAQAASLGCETLAAHSLVQTAVVLRRIRAALKDKDWPLVSRHLTYADRMASHLERHDDAESDATPRLMDREPTESYPALGDRSFARSGAVSGTWRGAGGPGGQSAAAFAMMPSKAGPGNHVPHMPREHDVPAAASVLPTRSDIPLYEPALPELRRIRALVDSKIVIEELLATLRQDGAVLCRRVPLSSIHNALQGEVIRRKILADIGLHLPTGLRKQAPGNVGGSGHASSTPMHHQPSPSRMSTPGTRTSGDASNSPAALRQSLDGASLLRATYVPVGIQLVNTSEIVPEATCEAVVSACEEADMLDLTTDCTNVHLGHIDSAIARAEHIGVRGERARVLLRTVKVIRALRSALLQNEFQTMVSILDEARGGKLSDAAQDELLAMLTAFDERAVLVELSRGLSVGPIRGSPGQLELSETSARELGNAIVYAMSLGCHSNRARCLLSSAIVVLTVREALLRGASSMELRMALVPVDAMTIAPEAKRELDLVINHLAASSVINALQSTFQRGRPRTLPLTPSSMHDSLRLLREEISAHFSAHPSAPNSAQSSPRALQFNDSAGPHSEIARRLEALPEEVRYSELDQSAVSVAELDVVLAETAHVKKAGELLPRLLQAAQGLRELRKSLRTSDWGMIERVLADLPVDEVADEAWEAHKAGASGSTRHLQLIESLDTTAQMYSTPVSKRSTSLSAARPIGRAAADQEVESRLARLPHPAIWNELLLISFHSRRRGCVLSVLQALQVGLETTDVLHLLRAVEWATALCLDVSHDGGVREFVGQAFSMIQRVRDALDAASDALQSRRMADLKAALDFATALGLKHKILDDVQALLDALQRLSTEAREACDVVDSERMRDVLEAAEDLGVTLGNDAELRRMLSLPLQNRQQLRLRRALALQDLDEIVKATIDIKTLFFANSAARWGLPYFPGLKPVARFLMMLSSATGVNESNWLCYSPRVLHTSLTDLSAPDDEQFATRASKLLLCWTGDLRDPMLGATQQARDKAALILLEMALNQPRLRDEVYCQILRHVTDNHKPESEMAGWKMILMMLFTTPPSESLENHVEQVIRDHYKQDCLYALHRSVYLGARQEVPDLAELKVLTGDATTADIGAGVSRPQSPEAASPVSRRTWTPHSHRSPLSQHTASPAGDTTGHRTHEDEDTEEAKSAGSPFQTGSSPHGSSGHQSAEPVDTRHSSPTGGYAALSRSDLEAAASRTASPAGSRPRYTPRRIEVDVESASTDAVRRSISARRQRPSLEGNASTFSFAPTQSTSSAAMTSPPTTVTTPKTQPQALAASVTAEFSSLRPPPPPPTLASPRTAVVRPTPQAHTPIPTPTAREPQQSPYPTRGYVQPARTAVVATPEASMTVAARRIPMQSPHRLAQSDMGKMKRTPLPSSSRLR